MPTGSRSRSKGRKPGCSMSIARAPLSPWTAHRIIRGELPVRPLKQPSELVLAEKRFRNRRKDFPAHGRPRSADFLKKASAPSISLFLRYNIPVTAYNRSLFRERNKRDIPYGRGHIRTEDKGSEEAACPAARFFVVLHSRAVNDGISCRVRVVWPFFSPFNFPCRYHQRSLRGSIFYLPRRVQTGAGSPVAPA